ncbi:hypothetical protein BH20ACT3_BH20ACT3_18720 [soil metagenome]
MDATARGPANDPDPATPPSGPVAPGGPAEVDGHDLSSFTALSHRVMVMWRLTYAVLAGVALVGALVLVGVNGSWPVPVRVALPATVAIAGVVLVVVVAAAEYRRWRYLVTDDGIELRHGLIIRNESSIPHFRVQHVDVRHGVLQRWLGIVSLSISTASPATDAELPGVEPERAEAIRRLVLDRAEADDGV